MLAVQLDQALAKNGHQASISRCVGGSRLRALPALHTLLDTVHSFRSNV